MPTYWTLIFFKWKQNYFGKSSVTGGVWVCGHIIYQIWIAPPLRKCHCIICEIFIFCFLYIQVYIVGQTLWRLEQYWKLFTIKTPTFNSASFWWRSFKMYSNLYLGNISDKFRKNPTGGDAITRNSLRTHWRTDGWTPDGPLWDKPYLFVDSNKSWFQKI